MQTYRVSIKSNPSTTFRAKLAAQSVDLNVDEKLTHTLEIKADIPSKYKIGMIIGPSGSGKTTLAKQMFGDDCMKSLLEKDMPIIDQFPSIKEYEDVAKILNSVGLSQIPCWLKKPYELSNGQQARAEVAVNLANSPSEVIVIDEWTSVVDRTVAKAMSSSLSKYKNKKPIVLISCHYDIIEWIDPDWIIDCATQTFIDRTKIAPEERKKKEQLHFDLLPDSGISWNLFSKYHYLNAGPAKGKQESFCLYHEGRKIGFCNFVNYVPRRKGAQFTFHSNRVVLHPDFVGFSLGLKMVNAAAKVMKTKYPGTRLYAKFSSKPMLKARLKDKHHWRLIKAEDNLKVPTTGIGRFKNGVERSGVRLKVKTYTFLFVG